MAIYDTTGQRQDKGPRLIFSTFSWAGFKGCSWEKVLTTLIAGSTLQLHAANMQGTVDGPRAEPLGGHSSGTGLISHSPQALARRSYPQRSLQRLSRAHQDLDSSAAHSMGGSLRGRPKCRAGPEPKEEALQVPSRSAQNQSQLLHGGVAISGGGLWKTPRHVNSTIRH